VAYWADTLVIIIAFLRISQKPLSEVMMVKKEDIKDYAKLFLSFKRWVKNKSYGK